MGVGGNFWDMLKPYARTEGFDFLRNKRVAIDLSYWIVQHETAIKLHTRNPHLRLTFFRTINLFSKFGAFPVFVADGTPSPLKSQARIMRFFQSSGLDLASLPVPDGTSVVDRNNKFLKCVQECVELLELFGMPVLKASGEAEGLCAQLNKEGHVDACITSDSDAFLFGAKCIIKRLKPNSQEPFECYHMSDIEAGLGLKRNHLIAIALLVGNDYDLKGVQGIGLETALTFVKSFDEDEVLDRLCELGGGNMLINNSDESILKTRLPHCSLCGHPGSKRSHFKDSCERCSSTKQEGCLQKPIGFKCDCSSCEQDKKEKEQKKNEAWKMKVCTKIATEPNFPNNEIIQMYLNNQHTNFTGAEPFISWKTPNTEMLIDYLAFKLNWEPSFIRQKLFPFLSTIFLRNIAKNQDTDLLYGQYEFDCIQRTKIRVGHTFYLVSWKKSTQTVNNNICTTPSKEAGLQEDYDELVDTFDEADVTNVRVDDGCLMTDENMDLVMAAYPERVDQFLQQKEFKEAKSRKKGKAKSAEDPSSSPSSRGVQLNITQFYRSSKGEAAEKIKDDSFSVGKRDAGNKRFSKSARRRLLLG
ncbi:putative spleen exonuclease [Helianthus annuus]|uniref:Flap endonuclease GEN-like 1 n=1 Tax=Helianthus annuus TaxID=4232 RepID=A0A251VBV6_HELAN|nr:flap endonuclease GEN-like 1 [Helianthus annuus]KAF5816802.1 putative spleen exonuclease [Helianthus annuus]KAJ0595012.1 putative spleen exonuclease [Helianthus annuus]KAJ0603374.1 putative spleen exonuclease [Helianthus annuus]KAJ0610066.1 putative spleen exonuclease [Helianthus annuus]KAJ0775847.1 putative spleen exonuclease [Helianthus annuus]